MWSFIASILVFCHLALELAHYAYEYIAAKRGKNILIDIQRHRLRSKKTERLIQIQKDLDLIKRYLGIDNPKNESKAIIKHFHPKNCDCIYCLTFKEDK